MRLRRVLRGLGLFAAALLLALFLAEIAARLLGLRPPARGAGAGDQLIEKTDEAEAPGVGWALAPNTSSQFVYPGSPGGEPRIVHERINADGWRDRLYPKRKPGGVFRIAVLGDSVTYGTGVEAEATFPKALEAIFAERLGAGRVEVLNCGVFNTNTGQQVGLLRWKVLDWKPDLVVICSTIADTSGFGIPDDPVAETPFEVELVNTLGLTSGIWHTSDLGSATPAQRRCMALRRTSVLADFLANRSFSLLMGRVQVRNYLDGWSAGSPGLEHVFTALERLDALSKKHGFELWVTLFPFLSELSEDHPFLSIHATMEAACRERGLGYIDLLQPFMGLDAGALRAHAHDRHPNGIAHRIAAEELAKALQPSIEAGLARPR